MVQQKSTGKYGQLIPRTQLLVQQKSTDNWSHIPMQLLIPQVLTINCSHVPNCLFSKYGHLIPRTQLFLHAESTAIDPTYPTVGSATTGNWSHVPRSATWTSILHVKLYTRKYPRYVGSLALNNKSYNCKFIN